MKNKFIFIIVVLSKFSLNVENCNTSWLNWSSGTYLQQILGRWSQHHVLGLCRKILFRPLIGHLQPVL